MGLNAILQKGRRVSEWFGRHQNWYLQLGIAGFIIAGVHLGADRIDDGCFAVLNFIDRIIDEGMARLFSLAQFMGLTSPEGARDLSYGFADLVDVEAREAAARWVAVGVELWVDFVLGRAALRYREDPAFGTGLFDMLVELGRTVKAFAGRARALDRSRGSGLAAPDRFASFGRYLSPGERLAIAPQVTRIMALAIAHRLGWPVPEDTRISSAFGVRIHPITKKRSMHTGIDLPVPRGTAVRASAGGIVRYAGMDGINGRYLKIDHGYGLATVMCHNSRNLYDTGDPVRRSTAVALSGSTGRSTGPHLHFGVKVGKKFVDPLPLLRFAAASCAGQGSCSADGW